MQISASAPQAPEHLALAGIWPSLTAARQPSPQILLAIVPSLPTTGPRRTAPRSRSDSVLGCSGHALWLVRTQRAGRCAA